MGSSTASSDSASDNSASSAASGNSGSGNSAPGNSAPGNSMSRSIGRSFRATGRGLPLAGLALAECLAFLPAVLAISMLGLGVGIWLVPGTVLALRGVVTVTRRLTGAWSGVRIDSPYLPRPAAEPGFAGQWSRTRWILTDPATWRDLAWSLVDPVIGALLTLLPSGLVAEGVFGLLQPKLWGDILEAGGSNWYLWIHVQDSSTAWRAAALGVPLIVAGFACAPSALRAHARLARTFLGPTETSRRMRHLAETRSDAVSSSAAELRRIERDLHDGAQARLVALGMNLGVAEQLLKSDPDAVAALLADTRRASAAALGELRDLVRGIHPPVLADRGLPDAVRALALDSPLDIAVEADLPGRAEAPVESAMYFAVSEALTNCAKHADAHHVTVDLWYVDGRLRARVGDDGKGGADASRGTGLRGIERRLATFDGILAVTSPAGGPTTLTMELPCTLS